MGIAAFLQALGLLVQMKNGGQPNDVTKLLTYAFLGVRAGAKGKEYLTHATQVVQQLVDEDRALTDQELADLDASIEGKLARIAGVTPPPSPAPAPAPEPAAATSLAMPKL